jgi:uncharacterized membrane protein (DUF106 family)
VNQTKVKEATKKKNDRMCRKIKERKECLTDLKTTGKDEYGIRDQK